MKIDEKIIKRFEELIERGNKIERPLNGKLKDAPLAFEWQVNCISFLKRVFGENNTYSENFDRHFSIVQGGNFYFGEPVSIIQAAKNDYENGYLFDTRTLIEAEVFDDFLEQSEHLLSQGYFLASAVIAGCVLEDALRKLCDKNSITLPAKATIEPMNIELAKAGIYNKLWQKKITALADLRNKAAHNLGGFTDKDVEDMIRDVRRFTVDYFS